MQSALERILTPVLGEARTGALLTGIEIAPALLHQAQPDAPLMAKALALALFDELCQRVPDAAAYWAEQKGRKLLLDHGALRTVAAPSGALPVGRAAFERLLAPLGYRETAIYPLDRLSMTGYSFCHQQFPEDLPQYFISELHPERFSAPFQQAVERVIGDSRDPLDTMAKQSLDCLGDGGSLDDERATNLLRSLILCFARQHDVPTEEDYRLLLAESSEMAWIATEGNVFNHATDRVSDVEMVANRQREQGRAVKERVEVSRSGRVRQTALRAAPVERQFRGRNGEILRRTVPGSFFEFISRDRFFDPVTQTQRLDLAFDTGNAQGIFKMTAPKQIGVTK